MKWKAGAPTTSKSAEQLTAEGYRRISNAYGLVARIDRPDWLEVMALAMPGRVVADFCHPPGLNPNWGSALPREERDLPGAPSGAWCDYYRRCLSKDTHTVDQERFAKIPSSDHDRVGYVEIV